MMNTVAFPDSDHKSDTLSVMDKWFDDLIDNFRFLQKKLETDQSNSPERVLVETLMTGSNNEIAAMTKNLAQTHFVQNIIFDYLQIIKNELPEKLAFHYNDSEVLVWAELKDDDWEMEKSLILAEAKIKAAYAKFGYNMVSTFVENSDNLPIPNHYKAFKS